MYSVRACAQTMAICLLVSPVLVFAQSLAQSDAGVAPQTTGSITASELKSLTDNVKTDTRKVATSSAAIDQIQVARKRRVFMEDIAQKDPQTFLKYAIPSAARAKLPAAVQSEVEQQQTLSGTIDVLHIDDFTNPQKSRFTYHLNTGTERIEIDSPAPLPALASGSAVDVRGYKIGGKFVVDGGTGCIKVRRKNQPESVGLQRTLAILITSPGQAATPNKEDIRKTIFRGEFQKYYVEQSYGQVGFTGDVTDWITVPASIGPGCTSPTLDQAEVKNYLLQQRTNLARYDRIVFIVNGWAGGCAFVGKLDWLFNGTTYHIGEGWVGYPDSAWHDGRSPMSGFEYVLSHEMGHELGVMHANSWQCQGPMLDSNCSHVEYGNSFDVMGTAFYGGHFNAFYKDLLGWLNARSKVSITSSGTVKLSPIESRSGVRAAIVTNPSVPSIAPLYLEYRQPIGYDSVLSPNSAGIDINQVIPDFFPFPRLINANYASNSFGQPALMPGGTFAWPSHGISVEYPSLKSATDTPSDEGNSATALEQQLDPTVYQSIRQAMVRARQSPVGKSSTATVKVTIQPVACQKVGLDTTDINARTTLAAGSYGYLTFTLVDNDFASCAPSNVTVSTVVSGGGDWLISQYPDTVTIAPGGREYVYVNFAAPVDALGTRQLTTTITDTTNNRTYTITRTLTVVPPPIVTVVTPSKGPAGTKVTLSGSGFDPAPATHAIYIYDASSMISAYVGGLTAASSSAISFTFPSTFDSGGGKGVVSTQIPTPPGVYYMSLVRDSDGSWSNTVTFEISANTAAVQPPHWAALHVLFSSQVAAVITAIGVTIQRELQTMIR